MQHLVQYAARQTLGNHGVSTMQIDHKLIATKTAQHVRLPQASLQTLGYQLQHPVTKGVAERVIDDFEAIQIQEKNGKAGITGTGCLNRRVHPLGKQQPIGQTGQNITVGELFNAFLGRVLQSKVAHETNALHQLALVVAQCNP